MATDEFDDGIVTFVRRTLSGLFWAGIVLAVGYGALLGLGLL